MGGLHTIVGVILLDVFRSAIEKGRYFPWFDYYLTLDRLNNFQHVV